MKIYNAQSIKASDPKRYEELMNSPSITLIDDPFDGFTSNTAGACAGATAGGALGMGLGFTIGSIGLAACGTAVGVPLAIVVGTCTLVGALTGDKAEDSYLEHKHGKK